jgi:hypothetical protein
MEPRRVLGGVDRTDTTVGLRKARDRNGATRRTTRQTNRLFLETIIVGIFELLVECDDDYDDGVVFSDSTMTGNESKLCLGTNGKNRMIKKLPALGSE